MKRFLILLLSLITVFATGCGCNPDEPGDGYLPFVTVAESALPKDPGGLNAVSEEDIMTVIKEFSDKNENFENGENAYLGYYEYQENLKDGREATQLYFEVKAFNYKEIYYGDLVVKNEDYINAEDGEEEVSHSPVTLKLRGEQCYKVCDGHKEFKNRTLVQSDSGLTGAYSGEHRDGRSVLDYLLWRYDDDISLSVLLDRAVSNYATVKADGTKLFISSYYSFGGVTKKIVLLLNLAAGYRAADFDNGKPTAAQVANVLYFTADTESFMRDFTANKEIKITAQGGGTGALEIKNTQLTVNFIYNGRGGSTNLNIGFSDGELWFPADSFYVLCNKMGAGAFEIDKLTMFYFEIEAEYEAMRTAGGVKSEHECESYIMLDY